MNILVKTLKEDAILPLKAEFEKIDTDQTGMISMEELKAAIMNTQNYVSDEEIESMFRNIDYKGNNKLNYTEFIAASLSLQ